MGEYMGVMYIAVDFDGTIVTHDYPRVGRPVPYALDVLKKLNENSDVRLILLTMRSGETLEDAKRYLEDNGVVIWAANRNPTQKSWTNSPKVYAHIYIDDAALGCPLIHVNGERPMVDWLKVKVELKKIGVI